MNKNRAYLCVVLLGLALIVGCDDQDRKDPTDGNTDQNSATLSAGITLQFIHADDGQVIPTDHITRLVLIRYSPRPSAPEGVHYDKVKERTLSSNDYPNGAIRLAPGYYRVKHNSVYGKPPSGYYGQSEIVALVPDQIREVTITLHAAI